jgi:hypothetical protein
VLVDWPLLPALITAALVVLALVLPAVAVAPDQVISLMVLLEQPTALRLPVQLALIPLIMAGREEWVQLLLTMVILPASALAEVAVVLGRAVYRLQQRLVVLAQSVRF